MVSYLALRIRLPDIIMQENVERHREIRLHRRRPVSPVASFSRPYSHGGKIAIRRVPRPSPTESRQRTCYGMQSMDLFPIRLAHGEFSGRVPAMA
jgi:hypothetical protein